MFCEEDIFTIKAVQATSEMLLFLFHLNDGLLLKVWVWYRCQNRIESYYQSPWWRTINFLSKSTAYQNTQAEKKNVFAISSNSFDKNRSQNKVKCHIQREGKWLVISS